MIRKILTFGIMLGMMLSAMAVPRGFGKDNKDRSNNFKLSVWKSEMMGENTNIIVTPDGVFDMPEKLKEIAERIVAANEKGMTHAMFNTLLDELTTFLKDYPNYQKQTFIQMGNLYNYVAPVNMRNVDRAFQFYKMALPMAKSKSDIAQLYLMMASCFNVPGQEDMYQITQHLMKASKIDGRYASGIGDVVLCGWGSYCDFYLASTYYTIGMRNNDLGSTNMMYLLKYILEKSHWTPNDSLGFYDFERYMYYSRISNENEKAWMALMSSCQRGFVPSYYYAAYNFENTRSNISTEDQHKGMFNWMSKGAKTGFSPCIYGLAQIAENHTIDTAKGDIYRPDDNGQYSAADRRVCAKQAFELYKRAASMLNPNAMFALAEKYRIGNEFDYPKADIEQALYWYMVCAEHGNNLAFERVNELRNNAKDASLFEKQLQAATERARQSFLKNDGMQQKMFENILSNENFSQPRMLNNTYNKNHPDINVSDKNDILMKSLLNEYYKNAYSLLTDKLASIAGYENGYELSNVPFYQERMRELRLRSQGLGLGDDIRESMWESWDGE